MGESAWGGGLLGVRVPVSKDWIPGDHSTSATLAHKRFGQVTAKGLGSGRWGGRLIPGGDTHGGWRTCSRGLSKVATVLGRPLADPGPLVFGHGIEPVVALLAAGQSLRGMELAGGTAAVGFATVTAQQIEGALDDGLGALERAEGLGQSGVSAPELLAQAGQVGAPSESFIY